MDNSILVVIGLVEQSNFSLYDRRFLLTKRNQPEIPDAHECWQIPGGKVEFAEHPIDAIIREMKEELDLDIIGTELIPYVGNGVFTKIDGSKLHVVILNYLCFTNSKPTLHDHGASEFRYMPRYNLVKEQRVLPEALRIIDAAIIFMDR